MSRSLHMRRPPLTIGREAGYGRGGHDAYDQGGYDAYDDEGHDQHGYDLGGTAYGTHVGEASDPPGALHEPSGVDRQAKRLEELQARFAELRAKAESEAMEELMSSRDNGDAGTRAWEPRDTLQRGEDSRRHERGSGAATRSVAADSMQRRAPAPRQNRSGKAPKQRNGSSRTSNVAWLEKIKREVDGATDAADAEAWYSEPVESERASQSTRTSERSALRSRPEERSYGGRSSGGRSVRRGSSPPRDTSRRHVIRHSFSHGVGPDHEAPSRDEMVKLAARARAQQAFGDADFAETRSTHKLLQGQLEQTRQQRALNERRRQRDASSRRPVSAPRDRSSGQRTRSVRFETASPPRGSARDDTRGRFGVESTGREPPLQNRTRVRNDRRAVSAPRERRAKQPPAKQPWRSAAPAKGKEDPFELAGKFALHKEKVPRTDYSRTETSTAVELEVSAELSARVARCGVDPAKLAMMKQKLKAHSYGQTGQNPNKLFKHFDKDNTGQLEFDEFKAAVRKVGHMTNDQISDKELNKLFKSLDTDDSGDVGIDELAAFVWGKLDETTTRTAMPPRKSEGPEAAPTLLQRHTENSSEPAAAPSAGGQHREMSGQDALQTAAALSQAAIAPDSPAEQPLSAAEWRRQQFEDAAASGYVPSRAAICLDTNYNEWASEANGYVQHVSGHNPRAVHEWAAEASDRSQERTTYIDSDGVRVGTMRVAEPQPAPEPEPGPGPEASGYRGSDRHQRFTKRGVGGRQGVSMRQMRRHAGVDSKGRPPAKKIPVQENVVSEAASSAAGAQLQMTNPPPRQPKPRVDRVSTRSVRLRWTTEHGQDQGELQFFLYRSAYRNTGERVPDSVVEIPCGQEETWVDAFASKDQLAYQYGYVLIACNKRGEFSAPSPVAMVRPKKDERQPRSPTSRDSGRPGR